MQQIVSMIERHPQFREDEWNSFSAPQGHELFKEGNRIYYDPKTMSSKLKVIK
jgi:hypothetical protein